MFSLSIPGRRANNEDAVCARPDLGLFVVADGMGGYDGGEVASALAVDAIHTLVGRTQGDRDVTWPYRIDPAISLPENELLVATRLANDQIAARRAGHLEQMGSTVVVLHLVDGHAVFAHVGDSRLYLLRAGALAQVTTDHSLLAEMTASGHTPGPGFPWKHVVTRALGTHAGHADVATAPFARGDVFLLCTDGLTEALDEEVIARVLGAARTAEAACRQLVERAFTEGSRDNITAIVVRVI